MKDKEKALEQLYDDIREMKRQEEERTKTKAENGNAILFGVIFILVFFVALFSILGTL